VTENLTAARDNLAAVIALQTASWVAFGCPPTFSIDGESYDWNNWLAGKTAAMESLTKQIQTVSGPYLIRSRVRA
jgi:hypothetical protein